MLVTIQSACGQEIDHVSDSEARSSYIRLAHLLQEVVEESLAIALAGQDRKEIFQTLKSIRKRKGDGRVQRGM